MSDSIVVYVSLGGWPAPSRTRVVTSSGHVVAFLTTIAGPDAAMVLHSAYLGYAGEPAAATHLLQRHDAAPEIVQRRPDHDLWVADAERSLWLYDHLHFLLETLRAAGHDAQIDVDDLALDGSN